ALVDLVLRDVLIDELERHLGRFCQEALELFGIRYARYLHEDAVLTLALNRRLLYARGIHPAAHDFDRLVDRATLALLHGTVRQGQRGIPGAVDVRRHVAVDVAQRLTDLVGIGSIQQFDADRTVLDREPVVPDLGLLQDVADGVLHRLQLVANDALDIDFE